MFGSSIRSSCWLVNLHCHLLFHPIAPDEILCFRTSREGLAPILRFYVTVNHADGQGRGSEMSQARRSPVHAAYNLTSC
jgi:hypothetical protein